MSGHAIHKPYQRIHDHPVRIQVPQNQIIMNVEKYMANQLKIFDYDQVLEVLSKTVLNLAIEATLQLQAIVYHIGCHPFQKHYKSSVR